MPMWLIAGEFRLVGAAPDGDSVRFYPDDPDEWDLVRGRYAVRRNAGGGAQLRLEGIDALETHFTPEGGHAVHQPLDLAHAARDGLLRWLGFTAVEGTGRDPETVTAATPPTTRGYVLTRSADIHGRCVAFVGRGDPPGDSGSSLFVGATELRRTANVRALRLGLAYPTYYRGLFADLRSTLTRAAGAARPGKGLWARDRTRLGLTVESIEQVQRDGVILPKLFRRIVSYLALGDGSPSLAGLPGYLAQQDDRVFVLPEGHYTGFDTVVEVEGQTVRLARAPEDLIFEEK